MHSVLKKGEDKPRLFVWNTGGDKFSSIRSLKSGWKRVKDNFNHAGGYHGGLING